MVKLAVAILHRTVSASPGFDSRPMHSFCHSTRRYGGCRALGRVLVEFGEVWGRFDIGVCTHTPPASWTQWISLDVWTMHSAMQNSSFGSIEPRGGDG